MATSNRETKLTYHVRSTSLPSVSHPLTVTTEELLERLKSSKSASPSSSQESVCQKLNGLVELYDSIDSVLQLSSSQQAFSCETSHKKVLDGSLRLLDLCGTIRDVFSQTKQSVEELESSLRRKRGGSNCGFLNEVAAYLTCRKKMKKLILKSFDNMKRMQKTSTTSSLENETVLVMLLGDIEGASLEVFNTLLSFVSQQKGRSKSKSLSFVSMLLQSKRVSSLEESDMTEVEKLDTELIILNSKNSSNYQQVHTVLKKLQKIEISIQQFEDDLEALFRRLVKTRVSLLNIIN